MTSLMLVSLSGNQRGKTYIFDKETVLIGTDLTCDLRLGEEPTILNADSPKTSPIVAEILRQANGFQLFPRKANNCNILVNNNSISTGSLAHNVELQDGDLLGFQQNSQEIKYSLHFIDDQSQQPKMKIPNKNTSQEHLFPEVDVVGHIHPLTATRFLKGLAASLWAEVPRVIKLICLVLVLLLLVGGVSSLVYILYALKMQSVAISNLNIERDKYKQTIDELNKRNEDLRTRWEKEQKRFNSAQTTSETYQRGVCLLQGIYTYINAATGSQLRYLDTSFNNRALIDDSGQLNVSFEGTGAVFYESFSGTGFLIEDGKLLTNRHVVHPWWRDETDKLILAQGGRPEIIELYGYFPGIKPRFEVKVERFSNQNDVAICTFEQDDAAIPTLPLDPSDQGAAVGQSIVVIGYPTGVDGLIERLDDKVKNEIERKARTLEDRTQEVADRGLIHPLTTQGHINGLNAGRIIHDAATTEGGSGSPIFNSEGRVIGINASMLTTDRGVPIQGSNLGIPIRFALDLKGNK